MRSLGWAAAAALVLSSTTACNDDCATSADCPSGRYVCIEGECRLSTLPPPTFIPAVDVGPRPDLGFDLGFEADAAVVDAADAMPIDAADAEPRDADPMDTGVVSDLSDVEALVVVGAIQDNLDSGRPVAEARIFDYSTSGRRLTVRTEAGCTIRERGPGMGRGLTALRIELRNGTNNEINLTVDDPGTFVRGQRGDPLLFINQAVNVSYRIVSSGTRGSLGVAVTTSGVPVSVVTPFADPSAPEPLRFFAVSLVGPATQGANRLQVYDEDRTVEVSCPLNINSVAPPAFIADLYPSDEVVRMEIRSDAETVSNVPIVDGGSIPVTFRATRGLRYRVLIP